MLPCFDEETRRRESRKRHKKLGIGRNCPAELVIPGASNVSTSRERRSMKIPASNEYLSFHLDQHLSDTL
jgi:hypothetical protein